MSEVIKLIKKTELKEHPDYVDYDYDILPCEKCSNDTFDYISINSNNHMSRESIDIYTSCFKCDHKRRFTIHIKLEKDQ